MTEEATKHASTFTKPGPARRKSDKKVEPLGRCLVTGGAGFLGSHLVQALLDQDIEVVVLDRVECQIKHKKLITVVADLSDKEALLEACEGVDCVFHTASIIELAGGFGVTKAYKQLSYEVNVEGTRALLDAARKAGVNRFVYTSSNSVCFDSKPITMMNSDTPYAQNLIDMYTETKIEAEKLVLSQNGSDGMQTGAIRPCGIYGASSNIMLDSFVEEVASGKLVMTLGNLNSTHENTFVENLVHGHILCAERLVEGNRCCGRGYFISDHEPQNYFEFFRPLIEGLGYQFPKFSLPVGLLVKFLALWQFFHFRLGFPRPFLLPMQVIKITVTHLSDIREPFEDIDYKPLYTVKEAMEICMPYCQELHDKFKNGK
jgi:3beta-hydroxy-delta5-steroid dehydrogenase/steroid delta-isomerase